MHIEIRKQGKKKKYYLSYSFRKDGNVKKIRFYLGTNLKPEDLKEKRKYAEKIINERINAQRIIHDPLRAVLSKAELSELKTLAAKGSIKINHLSESEWGAFTKAFAYDTNAIEGSEITESEVGGILDGSLPESRPKYEIAETFGVSDAIKHLRQTKEAISLSLIKELHRIVFKGSKAFAGNFRQKGVEVAVVDAKGDVIHKGAPSACVISLLCELIRWYDKNKEKYPPIVLAAVVHNQFENIHPFADGNGRVGRLLLNNILLKHGFPPVNIELRNRIEYYDMLREYEEKGNLRPTIELILKEYKSLKKIING